MLLSAVLVCVIALATATVVLLAVGVRVRVAAALVGPVLAALVSAFAGVVATRLWSVPVESIWDAGTVLTASALVISLARPRWNPVAQAFAGIAIGSSLVYLAFGAIVTFASGLSAIASIASGLLLILEAAALTLSDSFAFESFDVLCTPHPVERPFGLNPLYRPMVSLQVAAYNEPPDMLIETIRSLEAIDYPNFEVVVIDNNTKDPAVWQPVADYCEGRNRVRFVHVDDWPGYTSGALNLVLAEYTHPDAELIGVIDADYLVTRRTCPRSSATSTTRILAAAGWLSLSWTVAYASIQGLFRKEGAFLRTPKVEDRKGVLTAVWTARTESLIALPL